MRQEGILADSKDITAFLMDGDTERKSRMLLSRFSKLECFILSLIPDGTLRISSKQLNESALRANITTSKEKDIFTLIYFLTVKGYIRKKEDATHNMEIGLQMDKESTIARMEKRFKISAFVLEWLYKQQGNINNV
jgi:ATP-dependent DNA helicase RecQ